MSWRNNLKTSSMPSGTRTSNSLVDMVTRRHTSNTKLTKECRENTPGMANPSGKATSSFTNQRDQFHVRVRTARRQGTRDHLSGCGNNAQDALGRYHLMFERHDGILQSCCYSSSGTQLSTHDQECHHNCIGDKLLDRNLLHGSTR